MIQKEEIPVHEEMNTLDLRRKYESEIAMKRIIDVAVSGGNISEATEAELDRISQIRNLKVAV